MFCLEKFSQNKENDLKLETKSVSVRFNFRIMGFDSKMILYKANRPK